MINARSLQALAVCALLLAPGCVGDLLFPSPPPKPKPVPKPKWEISGGWVHSARTDSGSGGGWIVTVGRREPESGGFLDLFGGVAFQGELSRLTGGDRPVTRFVFGVDLREDWFNWGGGFAFCGGDELWGVGLHFRAGVGHVTEHAEVRLAVGTYVWLGERDDEFDVDAEVDLRLTGGLRF